MEILDNSKNNPSEGGASFTLRNRIYRLTWSFVWLLLASWTPPPFHAWRRRLLIAFGARMAPSARVYGSASIWSPANLEMGHQACIGPRANVYSMAKISLGSYSLVSQGAHICAGSHDIEDTGFQLFARPIHIGSRAWVAAEAFVGPGVTIGDGAVLGARGVAFKDMEAWTVYAGNPAKKIKLRNIRYPDAEG